MIDEYGERRVSSDLFDAIHGGSDSHQQRHLRDVVNPRARPLLCVFTQLY